VKTTTFLSQAEELFCSSVFDLDGCVRLSICFMMDNLGSFLPSVLLLPERLALCANAQLLSSSTFYLSRANAPTLNLISLNSRHFIHAVVFQIELKVVIHTRVAN
jgi:hypothetical protein